MESGTLLPDFRDLLKSLNDHEIDYVVVGGYAVIAHGYVRTTKDLDILISADIENAEKVALLLKAFFGSTLPAKCLVSPRLLLRMGRIPAQVEMMTSISGVIFRECRDHAIMVEMDGIIFPVLSLADLRKAKAASGRPQDLADLDNLPEA